MLRICNCFYYNLHEISPEPNILLFRRPLGTNGRTGRVDPEMAQQQLEEYKRVYERKLE